MNCSKNIGILMLAAGQSYRFGSDKLMAKMPDGRPVIAHSLEPLLLLAAKNNLELCIIVRANNLPLINYLTLQKINFSICPDAHLGMGNSIAHGVKSNPNWQGWLIALADMPNITQPLLDHLLTTINEDKNQIVRPLLVTQGQKIPANPVYFPASYRHSLKNLTGDNGAKKLIRQAKFITRIEGKPLTESIMIDVDTPEILLQLHKQKERTI